MPQSKAEDNSAFAANRKIRGGFEPVVIKYLPQSLAILFDALAVFWNPHRIYTAP